MVPKDEKQKTRLPFDKGFIGGILIVMAAREVARAIEATWILYAGLIVGGVLCIRAVFRALKSM
jgi:hypothetical protein